MVVGAVNGQNNLLFWFFGLAVAGLLISGVLSGWVFIGLTVERVLPTGMRAGSESRVEYRLRRKGLVTPGFGLLIEELDATGAGRPLIRTVLAYMPARGTALAYAPFVPGARGILTVRRVRVFTSFPFGLVGKSVTFDLPASEVVRPAEAVVARAALRSMGGRDEAGSRARSSRSGEEFFSLRDFGPGDTLRSVAWRPTARLGHPVVREMSDQESTRLLIEPVVAGLSPGESERVVEVAAGLARAALRLGWHVGLEWGERSLRPGNGGGRQFEHILDALAIDPQGPRPSAHNPPGTPPPRRVRVVARAGDSHAQSANAELGIDDPGITPPQKLALDAKTGALVQLQPASSTSAIPTPEPSPPWWKVW
jgi:uncharacterized protein (DUF58 family)